MFNISLEKYQIARVYNIIDKEKKLWLRIKDIGQKLGVENIYDLIDQETKGKFERNNLTEQQVREYKRHVSELIKGETFMYTHENIIIPIIMHCRISI